MKHISITNGEYRAVAALVVLAILAGCAGPARTSKVPPPPVEGGNSTTRLMIAEIALQRGDFPTAAREYSNAAYLAGEVSLAERATRVAFEYRQYLMAAQSARRWLALSEGNADARRYLGVTLLRLFRIGEAAEQFVALLKHDYESPQEGLLDLAARLSDEDSPYGVLAVSEALAEHYPQLAEAHYSVAVAALRANNYERAIESSRKALELKPDLIEAERILGRALLVSGKSEEGLNLARMRAAASENDPQARLEVGLLLAAAGMTESARAELTPLLEVPQIKPEALRTLANLDLGEGRLDEAARHFTELLTTGRYVSLAFYSLGAIYERRKEPVRAIHYYTRVAGGPYAADAHLRAARLLVENGAREQANALLDEFVNQYPVHHVDVAIGRSRMLADEGDGEAALRVLAQALRVYPDIEELHYATSVVLERLGRVNEAIAELRGVVNRRPGDPVAMNALGYTLAEHKRNLGEAEDLVRRALEMTPDNPAVQDSMGWVLYRLGREEEALAWLEKAYGAQQDAEIAAHIGEVYWALGQRNKAREIWQAALAIEPDHRYLLRTLRRYPD